MSVIILAGLSDEAKSLIARDMGERHETPLTYGYFPPFKGGLPLFEYILEDGTILIERANAFEGDSGNTVWFKELCCQDGLPIPDTSWDMDLIEAIANND